MTITAKIIADSISPAGHRLTTFQLRYPRFIHSEFMTHRDLSRNASSSRAIPAKKMIEELRRDPAMPVHWGSNKPGMQAGDELEGVALELVKSGWLGAMEQAIGWAENMMNAGLHKQVVNRILEPWAHINVVVTATNWNNFFTLRCHEDAQPEIHALALEMFNAMAASHPVHLKVGQWHLPYIDDHTWDRITASEEAWLETAIKTSVARCARVSYMTHDGRDTTVQEDLVLYDRLLGAQPLHASPAEHQATPDEGIQQGFNVTWMRPELHGNFTGWIQYRKTLPGERVPG